MPSWTRNWRRGSARSPYPSVTGRARRSPPSTSRCTAAAARSRSARSRYFPSSATRHSRSRPNSTRRNASPASLSPESRWRRVSSPYVAGRPPGRRKRPLRRQGDEPGPRAMPVVTRRMFPRPPGTGHRVCEHLVSAWPGGRRRPWDSLTGQCRAAISDRGRMTLGEQAPVRVLDIRRQTYSTSDDRPMCALSKPRKSAS